MHPSKKSKRPSKRQNRKSNPSAPPFNLCSSSPPSFSEAIASVSEVLKSRKKILVLSGAGISVSCGIPDFRSPQGLYANLDTQELGLVCPEDLFDLECFQDDPSPFYKFAKALYFPLGNDKRVEPSDSHRFLALLEKQGKLLRVYTQNIDGLEEVAGVSPKRMVYAHGSLRWATCVKCKQKVSASAIEKSVKKGQVAHCQVSLKSPKCIPAPSKRVKRSRSSSNEEAPARISTRSTAYESQCPTKCSGVLKPDVTFFGETLQDKVRRCLEADRDKADALIVIGTSLSVSPMSKVIQYLPPNIPRILINRTIVSPPPYSPGDDESDEKDNEEQEFREDYTFDAYLLGFCDDVTRALVKEMEAENVQNEVEGQILSAMGRSDTTSSEHGWQTTPIPHDRILLFPGAIASTGDTNEGSSYVEVAHCDGCNNKIIGTIRKCIQCFDYDLCHECYPRMSKKHFNGEHKFAVDKQETEFF
mmetsp:Transcript_32026/g.48701  ORF Transcript_32026/g.48701 Transcript_32026/m.48701 type:complete len:474 (-) Transcript_32026:153-1574(-)|eukprot:CAMPEP_0194254662 /NCGR_PEP_ID=MMETSP0158-20130606/32707_1 /TAXON_ID=33649 /ORGANISM="Thalassionema nitzschioides, Strain L26-B" /LENGTH=473 /DNA_ID=CAMNT_0038992785 /DNA_START=82 /DNA_END=1503 /DNA_ORIENTATION=+